MYIKLSEFTNCLFNHSWCTGQTRTIQEYVLVVHITATAFTYPPSDGKLNFGYNDTQRPGNSKREFFERDVTHADNMYRVRSIANKLCWYLILVEMWMILYYWTNYSTKLKYMIWNVNPPVSLIFSMLLTETLTFRTQLSFENEKQEIVIHSCCRLKHR